MKKFILGSFIALTFLTQNLFAHGDHYELTKGDANVAAKTHIDQLIAGKKLPEGWNTATPLPASTVTKAINGKQRWVVVFENEKETDTSKKKIEVILTPAGKLVTHQFAK